MYSPSRLENPTDYRKRGPGEYQCLWLEPVARSHPYHRILRSTPYFLPAHQFHFHRAIGPRPTVDWLSERNTDSPCSIVHGHGMGNFCLEVVSVPLRVLPGPGTPHFHSNSSIQNLHIGHPWPLELVTLNGKTGYYRSSLDRINIGLLGNDHPLLLVPASRGRMRTRKLPRSMSFAGLGSTM